MSDDKIKIQVDGKTLEAERGQMLIEVTDKNDIYIPRFCYHPKLTVAANCRMCLVEVEKAPKPLPACATPVMDGMVVKTQSETAIGAQKSVMEFLLINHPLDCPICDQGGECELQDMAMGYGRDVSRYQENKRVVKDKDIGPLVQTDMTRCIHCTRCVRFGEEIAGMRELGATGRGEHMEIGTYIEKSMSSELSGNIIDVCPVGALTSKPFRFSARAWEMKQAFGIAPHDCVGSNVEIHYKGNVVKRVVPDENEAINEIWLSDRDRFSYEGLYTDDRLTSPMIKVNGSWQKADWEEALDFCAKALNKTKENAGADSTGALISPSATFEEQYMLQGLMRGLGSNNIDHRLRQQDFRQEDKAPAYPALGQSIQELENSDVVLLIGSNIRQEQPLLNLRLRKAALKGGRIMALNPLDFDFNYTTGEKIIVEPSNMVAEFAAVTLAVVESGSGDVDASLKALLKDIECNDTHKAIAKQLVDGERSTILLGTMAIAHADYSILQSMSQVIAKYTTAKVGCLTEGANCAGAWLAGAIPHRAPDSVSTTGLNTQAMLDNELQAYILFNLEPEIDLLRTGSVPDSINKAGFVMSFTAYKSEAMLEYADALLPISLFAENEGTFVNIEGKAQSFNKAVAAPGEARPGWKILRVLANKLELDGFQQNSIEEIQKILLPLLDKSQANTASESNFSSLERNESESVTNSLSMPMYSIDPMLRRAESLSKVSEPGKVVS